MDISFLNQYAVPVVTGICLCVGYVLKSAAKEFPNRYIPLAMAVLGVILNLWVCKSITPEVLLQGMVSGLASTGIHQAVTNLGSQAKKNNMEK